MSTCEQPWSYSLLVEEEERLLALLKYSTFAQITERIVSEMCVLCGHCNTMTDTGFHRPVYTVQIERPLFDLFFNSSAGYRAAYFQSPGAGFDANVFFMRAVAQRLVDDSTSNTAGLPAAFLHESLTTPSAKVWLAECGKETDQKCPGCQGEWSARAAGPAAHAEIMNGRWDTASRQKAEWGRKAPYLTKLRIMGAFINDRHHELVPHDKRFRADEIHRLGWS